MQTYNALGKYIASNAAPVWSTNASDSRFKKIQTAQNAALRTATGARKMASIDHLDQESFTLRYAFCAVPGKLFGGGPRQSRHHNSRAQTKTITETLHSRHHSTVLPRLGSSRIESHQNLHTHVVDSAIQFQGNNRVLKKRRTRSRDSTEDNDALSHNYGQDTAIYCRTTSIGC